MLSNSLVPICSWLYRGIIGAALVTCLCVPSVSAAVIYDESAGGDLGGNQGAPVSLGTLILGTNTFKGLDSRATDGPGGQGDGFKMTLNPLHVVTSITFTLTNYTSTDTAVITLFRPASPSVTFQVFRRVGPTSGDQVLIFPIPTTLPAEFGFSVQLATSLQATSFNWQWDVEVAEAQTQVVPEASSVYLMAAGLVSMAFWRRRRS